MNDFNCCFTGHRKKDENISLVTKRTSDVEYVSTNYSRSCMYKRNRKLVDFSSACICYLNKNNGGTFYTVGYSKQKGLEIINNC